MNEDIQRISTIITIIVILCLFISYSVLFYAYYKYYIKCLENNLVKIEMKTVNNKKKEKIINIISRIITYSCYLFISIIFIFSITSKIETGLTKFFSNSYLLVKTSSMEVVNEENTYIKQYNLTDQIKKYSLVSLDTNYDITLYGVYAFYDDKGNIIIHRLVSINEDKTYTFKGDANKNSFDYETKINKDKIIAKYNGYSSYVTGVLFMYLKSNIGIISFSIAIVLILYFEIINYLIDKKIKTIIINKR